MGFFDRAWGAAADEYGRSRAERYGQLARLWRAVQLLGALALAAGVVWLWAGR